MQNEVKNLYKQIQSSIIKSIPEKWNSIYLYASVINGRRGEMFFYYFPKRIIKTKPVNCYEVPNKFDLDENKYNENLERIYENIKLLNQYAKTKWTNVTIIIKDGMFTAEYHYNNIQSSIYNDAQRHIVWCYKYLKQPLESMNHNDRLLVQTYQEETKLKPTIYTSDMNKIDNQEIETKNQIRNQILKC